MSFKTPFSFLRNSSKFRINIVLYYPYYIIVNIMSAEKLAPYFLKLTFSVCKVFWFYIAKNDFDYSYRFMLGHINKYFIPLHCNLVL